MRTLFFIFLIAILHTVALYGQSLNNAMKYVDPETDITYNLIEANPDSVPMGLKYPFVLKDFAKAKTSFDQDENILTFKLYNGPYDVRPCVKIDIHTVNADGSNFWDNCYIRNEHFDDQSFCIPTPANEPSEFPFVKIKDYFVYKCPLFGMNTRTTLGIIEGMITCHYQQVDSIIKDQNMWIPKKYTYPLDTTNIDIYENEAEGTLTIKTYYKNASRDWHAVITLESQEYFNHEYFPILDPGEGLKVYWNTETDDALYTFIAYSQDLRKLVTVHRNNFQSAFAFLMFVEYSIFGASISA